MKNLEYKGRWVTDDYMAGLIEQEFADTVAAGETLFHYTTTIQNHMSYTLDKYGESYAYPEVPLNTAVSDEAPSPGPARRRHWPRSHRASRRRSARPTPPGP